MKKKRKKKKKVHEYYESISKCQFIIQTYTFTSINVHLSVMLSLSPGRTVKDDEM